MVTKIFVFILVFAILNVIREIVKFLQAMKARPNMYATTIPVARTGHGGALEKWFRDYIALNGLAPRDPLLQRYLPTAEHRVRIQQEHLIYRANTPEKQQNCLVQIIGSRMAVSAKRGGFTGMDNAMKKVPDSETFLQCCELAREGLQRVPQEKMAQLLEEAREGHGGKMMESFSKLTQITTQNWRGRPVEQAENSERESLRI